MKIPEAVIEDIMRRADIVDVAQSFFELKRAGDNDFKACCPFHNEKTPSFHINPAKQVYHCFGCGVGGNLITLVKALVNTDYVGAMQWLARRYNVDIPVGYDDGVGSDEAKRRRQFHDDGMRLLDAAAGWFQSRLNGPEGEQARRYLVSRGIDAAAVERYRIGYAPDGWDGLAQWAQASGFSKALLTATGLCVEKDDGRMVDRFRNRLMFTICDELSRVVAFSGRVMGPTPPNTGKYVNSPETDFFHKGSVLYGLNIARQAFRSAGWALICEGQLDVIACHRAGLEQAVASQGTAFTEEHVRMLAKANVKCAHLAFDGDAAGHKATLRTVKLLYNGGIQPMVTAIPAGDDPDGIFRNGGAEALRQIMGVSEAAIPFAFRVFSEMYPDGTPEARSAIVNEMMAVICCIQDDVARVGHCQWLAEQLRLPLNVLTNLVEEHRRRAVEAAQLESRRQVQMTNGAYGAYGEPALPDVQPAVMPQLALESGQGDRAVQGLVKATLDLALHCHEAARQFASADVMRGFTGDTPALQALNFILAGTAEDDWEGSVQEVIRGEWISDPVVSAVLTSSCFDVSSETGEGALTEMQAMAVRDCLRRAEELALREEQRRLQEKMAADAQTDGTSASEADILRNAIELARRRKGLRGR